MEFNELVAIVLAGNDQDAGILGGIGQPSKFFMSFGHELVGDRILRALDALECCKSVFVVVPPAYSQEHALASERSLHVVPQGETRTESLMNAVREARRQGEYVRGDHVLVITGDLPLLCAAALKRFIGACQEAQEADCYIGMVPIAAVDQTLRAAYQRDLMPFRGGLYLHSDVYLVRPDSLTEAGRKRFEQIMNIRRSDRHRPSDMLRAAVTVLGIVGLRGIFPFIRTVAAPSSARERDDGQDRAPLDSVERVALSLIEAKLGPRVSIVTILEPALALEFDHSEQLQLLVDFTGRSHPRSHPSQR